jgi:hypothetical protein
VIGLGVIVIVLPWLAGNRAEDVRNGNEVVPGRLPYPSAVENPLAIRAEVVDLRWIDGKPPAALKGCDCRLVYLGRAADIAVLYDIDNLRTLRLPASKLLLTRES